MIGLINDNEVIDVLKLIHPTAFHENYVAGGTMKGLTEISLAEGAKMQLINILDNLCDRQLRHRIESLIAFCEGFVSELQIDQCKRLLIFLFENKII